MWKLVQVLARVVRVGDNKAKVEIKALQQLFPEKVALNHAEVAHSLVADAELDPEIN